MGIYTVKCPSCSQPHDWFSGNSDQRCPVCKNGENKVTKEGAGKLYEGKYFYEIVKPKSGRFVGLIQLVGPLEDVRYKTDLTGFVQIIDDKIEASFTNEEILVTDRKL